MNFKALNKKNNKNVIVFFNGWGFDENIVSNLEFGSFDVFCVNDYKSFDTLNFDFTRYEKKYLIAWSLGVYVSNLYFENFNDFNGFTAINGTLKPIDDNFGIPKNSYELTINNFNELTRKKFIKKINAPVDIIKSNDDLKEELISIKNAAPKNFFRFNKAIISTKDRIFPYKNMYAFWSDKGVKIEEKEAPHYVFDLYKNWSELI